jgi:dethiobiotin synthetase
MSAPFLYVTGTNTEVGKTTLACLLLQRARERNLKIAALKPFSTGDRADAEKMGALQTAGLTLDEINPFHFSDPVTPLIAARRESRSITLHESIAAIRKIQARSFPILVEGAGGLLSPLGDKFSLLEIVHELPGKVCIVGPNSLGVINGVLLTRRALNIVANENLRIVLMNLSQSDASAETNADVIHDWTNVSVAKIARGQSFEQLAGAKETKAILDGLLDWWIG